MSSSAMTPFENRRGSGRVPLPPLVASSCVARGTSGHVFLDVLLSVAHALDLLGVFVRDLHPELFFEAHDELDEVEGVSVEVVDERGLWLHIRFVDAELLDDDLLEALVHLLVRQQRKPPCRNYTVPGVAPGARASVGLGTLARQSAPPVRPP